MLFAVSFTEIVRNKRNGAQLQMALVLIVLSFASLGPKIPYMIFEFMGDESPFSS